MQGFRIALFTVCAVLIVSNLLLYFRHRRLGAGGASDVAARMVGSIAMALLGISILLNRQRAASMLALGSATFFLAFEAFFRIRSLRQSAKGQH
jgi:uncharacterized membrane protein YfcA